MKLILYRAIEEFVYLIFEEFVFCYYKIENLKTIIKKERK